MEILRAGNVNQIWPQALTLLKDKGRPAYTRGGPVLVLDEPVMTEYLRPTERVLFCSVRNANPFFHLMESLWMLSGSRNALWLDQFVSDFSKRFAEEGGRQHGAYGYRWRNHFPMDQLRCIIGRLRKDPLDRRICLSMWDPEFDLFDVHDPGVEPKDIPCNTHVYFRIVEGQLDMTVMCRSNDIVWGAYGANVVHFSILQEYMSAMIGVPVGIYRQFSNNWHGYISVVPQRTDIQIVDYPDVSPLIRNKSEFDTELHVFMKEPDVQHPYKNEFLSHTAVPMFVASQQARAKKYDDALKTIDTVMALDWKIAAREWVLRKIK